MMASSSCFLVNSFEKVLMLFWSYFVTSRSEPFNFAINQYQIKDYLAPMKFAQRNICINVYSMKNPSTNQQSSFDSFIFRQYWYSPHQYYIIVKPMRKSTNSLKNLKTSKSTSQIRNSLPKVFSKISELYKSVSHISVIENQDCYDLQWIVEQQQQLSKLFAQISKHLSDKLYPQYLAKLESVGMILGQMKTRLAIPHEKLNSIDVQFTTSTHQTSCDMRPPGVNMNLCDTRPRPRKITKTLYTELPSSIEKLKQTIAVKESLLLKSYQKQKAKSIEREKYIEEKEQTIQTIMNTKAKIELEYKEKIRNLQQKLIQKTKEITKQVQFIKMLEKQLSDQRELRSQLMKQRQSQKDLLENFTKLNKINESNQCNRLKAELESVKNLNSKLQSQNNQKDLELDRLQEVVESLNEKIASLNDDIYQKPTQLLSELSKKNTIIQELAYDRQNYSDGYAHLRQQQLQSKEFIDKMKQTLQSNERQLRAAYSQTDDLRQKISEFEENKKQLQENLQQVSEQNKELRSEIKVLKGQLKGARGQLRAVQQKCDLLQQRYFRLRQNCCDSDELTRTLTQKQLCKASKSVTERSQKIALGNTHDKSTQRDPRKLKVIGDLRQLVKNHRLNLR